MCVCAWPLVVFFLKKAQKGHHPLGRVPAWRFLFRLLFYSTCPGTRLLPLIGVQVPVAEARLRGGWGGVGGIVCQKGGNGISEGRGVLEMMSSGFFVRLPASPLCFVVAGRFGIFPSMSRGCPRGVLALETCDGMQGGQTGCLARGREGSLASRVKCFRM